MDTPRVRRWRGLGLVVAVTLLAGMWLPATSVVAAHSDSGARVAVTHAQASFLAAAERAHRVVPPSGKHLHGVANHPVALVALFALLGVVVVAATGVPAAVRERRPTDRAPPRSSLP